MRGRRIAERVLGTVLPPAREGVARLVTPPEHPETLPRPAGPDLLDTLSTRPLPQPDRTSCGSCVLVLQELLYDAACRARFDSAPDQPAWFGREALAMRRRTNAALDARRRPQLPWPAALGTRPAALVRQLRVITGHAWHNRVIDPSRPERWYDAVAAIAAAGTPVPLYIGDARWMQHIVLVVRADGTSLTVYDPFVGRLVRRSRRQFCEGRLAIAGWDQPWLVIVP